MEESNILLMQYKLLGCYMENSDTFLGIENLIRHTDKGSVFTTNFTRKSYELIKAYHAKGIKPDIAILHQALKISGLSQSECSEAASLSSYSILNEEQIKEYADALFSDYVARYLSPILKNAIVNFNTSSPIAEMLKVKDAITTVEMALNNVSKDKSIFDIFDEVISELTDLKNGSTEQVFYSWGIKELDKKTGGIADGPNVVAATPGSGKTSLVITLAIMNCIIKGLPFLFFSLEMKATDLVKNIISNITEINSRAIREAGVDDDQLLKIKDVRRKLTDLFQIDETDGVTWQQIETKVRLYRKKHKIPISIPILVAIDFIQKMRSSLDETKGISQEQQVDIRMNELARIAKQENLKLIEISQFTRETSKRDNPRPKATDLKGSSSIEQNAVIILLMYRPEEHGIYISPTGIDLKGVCEINIAKSRFSDKEPVYARFEGKYSKFKDHEMYETKMPDNDIEPF